MSARKKLGLHVNREVVTPPPPPVSARGLFHDVDPIPGTQVFNLYTSDGIRRGRWEACEDFTDSAFLDAMRELLERRDPVSDRSHLQLARPDAVITDGEPKSEDHGMTAAQLIAEARKHREGAPPVVDAEYLRNGLTMLLEVVLDGCGYEREMTSTPAIVARAMAALIANVEDSAVSQS